MGLKLKDRRCMNCHEVKLLEEYNENSKCCKKCVNEIYGKLKTPEKYIK